MDVTIITQRRFLGHSDLIKCSTDIPRIAFYFLKTFKSKPVVPN